MASGHEDRPHDLPTYAGVAALLAVAVVLASLAPASKASRIAPVEALRQE